MAKFPPLAIKLFNMFSLFSVMGTVASFFILNTDYCAFAVFGAACNDGFTTIVVNLFNPIILFGFGAMSMTGMFRQNDISDILMCIFIFTASVFLFICIVRGGFILFVFITDQISRAMSCLIKKSEKSSQDRYVPTKKE